MAFLHSKRESCTTYNLHTVVIFVIIIVEAFTGSKNYGDINYLCTYDLYSPVHNVLDACISITRASGRGLGPAILDFLFPQMALAYQLDAISQGPKTLELQGPTPSQLP